MTFDGSQKIIGKGAQAEVLLYHGFAYKVYNQSYPAEWIAFEKQQQQAVNKAGLCPVNYYDTDDPHIIKMDLSEYNKYRMKCVLHSLYHFDRKSATFQKVLVLQKEHNHGNHRIFQVQVLSQDVDLQDSFLLEGYL